MERKSKVTQESVNAACEAIESAGDAVTVQGVIDRVWE